MAFLIFIGIFLGLPLLLLAWMTLERWRNRRQTVRGFEVKFDNLEAPAPRKQEAPPPR